jgi:CRP-like cAMP-binding protein
MVKGPSKKPVNRLLASLTVSDRALLGPLRLADLPVKRRIEWRDRRIDTAYFLESGIASVVAKNGNKEIEAGIIGREGMTGIAIILGQDRWPHETYMQVAGTGRAVSTKRLKAAMQESQSLREALLSHCYRFLVEATFTALANGRNTLEERLCRWLLMARDRLDSDELRLTHEFLALMLGVRRAGVTVALSLLERKGLVRRHRATIEILDKAGLIKMSGGSYKTL